jgi:hypothetical protein
MKQPELHPDDKESLLWIVMVYLAIAGFASFIIMAVAP